MNDPTPTRFVSLGTFAQSLIPETAFDVLAVAKRLKAQGKDIIELQIVEGVLKWQ